MREIKFRAKNAKDEWVYGSLIINETENNKGTFQVAFIVPGLPCASDGGDFHTVRMERVKIETIGQFTGLKDKNGVEVFEGDILKSRSIIHLVEYKEDEGAFVGRFNSFGAHFPSKPMQQPFYTEICQWWISKFEKEVIGNIHDNPELLKKKINFIKN